MTAKLMVKLGFKKIIEEMSSLVLAEAVREDTGKRNKKEEADETDLRNWVEVLLMGR